MKKNIIYGVLALFLFTTCSKNSVGNNSSNSTNSSGNNTEEVDDAGNGPIDDNNDDGNNNDDLQSDDWLIPFREVIDGGPGKDGIPSIDNPIFVDANSADANYLDFNDLVVGIIKGNEAKAYPHKILDWHEIINDLVDDELITISYCPLTGTAFAWESKANGNPTSFGVSGLLYNSNLILYDRNTDSNWSQLDLQCVNGSLIGEDPTLVNIVETDWFTWKSNYPNTKVLSLNTGFTRDYGVYPYGPYRTNNDYLIFPVTPLNTRLPAKERVHAIIDNDKSKTYRFSSFSDGKLVKETFNGNQYLIVGNNNLINSFKLTGDYANLDFEIQVNGLQVLFTDNEGNKWDIFGKAIDGSRTGEKLTSSKSVMSYWFAIAAFYPNPEIYSE